MSAHHGNTPAAWTAVVIGLIGFVTAGVGLMFHPFVMLVVWAGAAVLTAALPVFALMARLGLNDVAD